jgi:hypothetical protein
MEELHYTGQEDLLNEDEVEGSDGDGSENK